MSASTEPSRHPRLAVAGIMPLYNKRATVIEAIESMLAQTRPCDEIVVVDDGSTDGSGDLVEQRYGSHGRLRLVRQPNRGASAARNAGIRAARSPLLAFLDADDRWLPERIEKQAAFLESDPSCMLVWSALILCDEAYKISRVEGDKIDKATYLHKVFFRERLLPPSGGVTIRRSALDEVGMFDESLWSGEDTDLWLRIMVRFGFGHIPEPLVWMRRGREDSLQTKEHGFVGQQRYYLKHRHTFGRDWRGWITWRSAYGAALRGQAIWYFHHALGRKGLGRLARAVWTWPFFNPAWVLKTGLECLLGPRVYGVGAAAVRRVLPRRGQNT